MIFARRMVCVSISLILALTGIFIPQNVGEASAASAIKATNYSVPGNLYKGTAVTLKGKVVSTTKLTYVRVGIRTKKGKWISGKNVTVNPKKKKFNIKTVDTKIKFGKLKAGTYYYTVTAKNSSGSVATVINRKVTVSQMKVKSYTKPSYYMVKGRSFTLKGTVTSKFKMKKVRVGIVTTAGKWKSGFNKAVNPKSKKFSISKVDTSIKFGKLSTGTYRYVIYALDNKGKGRTLVSKTFKVVSPSTASYSSATAKILTLTGCTRLSYNSSVIAAIGRQMKSGPCGLYCMAYCRAILDGKFSKSGYDTYYEKLYSVYGHNSNYSHWDEGGGDSIWFTTAKSSYVRAIREIKKGKPCIIKLHNGYSGNNHYVTIIGYTTGTTESNVCLDRLIAIDPVFCQMRYLSSISYYSDTTTPQCIVF